MREDLPGYNPPAVPFASDYASWSREQAREYFDWFLQELEPRAETLRAVIAHVGDACPLDFGPTSLDCAGDFLKQHVRTRLLRPEERVAEREELAGQIPPGAVDVVLGLAGGWALDDATRFLCLDIGMYFGEVMRRAHRSLEWTLWTRRTIELNRPVLTGFSRGEPLDPVGLMEGVAIGMARGKHGPSRVAELFAVWSSRVEASRDV
jgi:hypothetical protein